MRWSISARAATAAAVLAAAPAAAWACPVCFGADEERAQTYFATGLLLSFLPVAFLGLGALGLAAAVRRRRAKATALEVGARGASVPDASGPGPALREGEPEPPATRPIEAAAGVQRA